MSGTFTQAQKTLIFELLELFQGTTYDWIDYNDRVTGVITSVPWKQQIDFTVATDRLAVILAAIEAASDGRYDRISTLLTEYNNVATDVATVGMGGGAGTAGARYSPRWKRNRLRELLQLHLGIQVRKVGFGEGDVSSKPIGVTNIPR